MALICRTKYIINDTDQNYGLDKHETRETVNAI